MRRTLLAGVIVSLSCASFCVPVWAQTNAVSAQQSTADDGDDALLDRLARAQDELESRHIAEALLRRWSQVDSDTINLLVARAQAAETAGASPLARGLLDYVVLLAPNWAEGFVRRARVNAAAGDDAGARADLVRSLEDDLATGAHHRRPGRAETEADGPGARHRDVDDDVADAVRVRLRVERQEAAERLDLPRL